MSLINQALQLKQFKEQVKQAGYNFPTEMEANKYSKNSYWEDYHALYVFKRIGLESFQSITDRKGLVQVSGDWYGYSSVMDACDVFMATTSLCSPDIFLVIETKHSDVL